MADNVTETAVLGGVDAHKDLHVEAVVDQNNKVLGTEYFSATRQAYRQMMACMDSFGTLTRLALSGQVPMVPDCFAIFSMKG